MLVFARARAPSPCVAPRRRPSAPRVLPLEQLFQQAQKLESLGVLAGGIAHDFNNLLTAVLGYAELARTELSPRSAAHESVTQITIAARRAAELRLQMLAYTGKASFALEWVNLGDLIEEMAPLLHASISNKAVLHLNLGARSAADPGRPEPDPSNRR